MKYIFLVTYFCCFLIDFYVNTGHRSVPFYYFVVGLFIFLMVVFHTRFLIHKIWLNINTKSFQILILFLFWAFVSILISSITGKFYFSGFVLAFLGGVGVTIFLVYCTMIIALPEMVSYKTLIKATYIFLLILFILGIIQFIGLYFHIDIINDLFNFLSNRRGEHKTKTRVFTLFVEPSYYGYFLVLVAPIVYYLSVAKEKLFKSMIIDAYLKKVTLILMIINLFLTQSPPFILMGTILLAILFSYRFLRTLKIPALIKVNAILLFILIILLIGQFDLLKKEEVAPVIEDTFVERIMTVIESAGKPDDLYEKEGSLMTRYVTAYNSAILFLEHPLFGIGYGNMTREMIRQLKESPIPIGRELEKYIALSIEEEAIGATSSIFFRTLAETGIIGIFLLFLFVWSLYFWMQKNSNLFEGIEKEFFNGLKLFLILFIITSFYTSYLHSPYLWIFFGIAQSMIVKSLSMKTE